MAARYFRRALWAGSVVLQGLLWLLIISNASAGEIPVGWDVPPSECVGELYKFNGEKFICQIVNRMDLITAQRQANYDALRVCEAKLVSNNSRMVMTTLGNAAAEACRVQGKGFSAITADCRGALPQPIKEKRE